jgi:hypothetical protein
MQYLYIFFIYDVIKIKSLLQFNFRNPQNSFDIPSKTLKNKQKKKLNKFMIFAYENGKTTKAFNSFLDDS